MNTIYRGFPVISSYGVASHSTKMLHSCAFRRKHHQRVHLHRCFSMSKTSDTLLSKLSHSSMLSSETDGIFLSQNRGLSTTIYRKDSSKNHQTCGSSVKEETANSTGVNTDGANKQLGLPEKLKNLVIGLYKRLFGKMSLRQLIMKYGLFVVCLYFFTNESLVCIITYLLHYNYIDIWNVIEVLGVGDYIDLKQLERGSWVLWEGEEGEEPKLEISARLITNFLVASSFMSMFTPVQFPICVWITQRLLSRRVP
eukprot:Tbor_TRINITY_DN3935_c0_g1::TRINITY_DN3935_c0_g1_i1::g.822::m.822